MILQYSMGRHIIMCPSHTRSNRHLVAHTTCSILVIACVSKSFGCGNIAVQNSYGQTCSLLLYVQANCSLIKTHVSSQ